jgi:hypothetical protein
MQIKMRAYFSILVFFVLTVSRKNNKTSSKDECVKE